MPANEVALAAGGRGQTVATEVEVAYAPMISENEIEVTVSSSETSRL